MDLKYCAAQPSGATTNGKTLHEQLYDREQKDCLRRGYDLTTEKLGSGTFSRVQKAFVLKGKIGTDRRVAKLVERNGTTTVAVKIINKQLAPVTYLDKFVTREMSNLLRLPVHDYVISAYDVFETSERVYIVMEYCDGVDMLVYMNKYTVDTLGLLPEEEVRTLFRQICTAVWHCHINGIVHRDIKCDNILVTRKMDIKLIDFGFSIAVQGKKKHAMLETPCGSLSYVAPEVVLNDKYAGKLADIWSLGIVLYVMLHGHVPFSNRNPQQSINDMKLQNLYFRKDLSLGCVKLIRRILEYDCLKRPSLKYIILDPWLVGGKMFHYRQPLIKHSSIQNFADKITEAGDGLHKKSQSLKSLSITLRRLRREKHVNDVNKYNSDLYTPTQIRRRRIPQKCKPIYKHEKSTFVIFLGTGSKLTERPSRFPVLVDNCLNSMNMVSPPVNSAIPLRLSREMKKGRTVFRPKDIQKIVSQSRKLDSEKYMASLKSDQSVVTVGNENLTQPVAPIQADTENQTVDTNGTDIENTTKNIVIKGISLESVNTNGISNNCSESNQALLEPMLSTGSIGLHNTPTLLEPSPSELKFTEYIIQLPPIKK